MKKNGMFVWEEKLIRYLEQHMFLLAALLSSALALYLRKVAVWWNYAGILCHFDHHANHTESAFYYLLLKGSEYLPLLPLHSFKWLGGLSDFWLALLCMHFVSPAKQPGRWELTAKGGIAYLLCLFSPVFFLRGIIWAQPDAPACALLLTAYLIWKKGQKNKGLLCLSVLLAGTALALAPCLIVIYLIALVVQKERPMRLVSALPIACALLLQVACALLLQESITEGIYSQLRFAAFDPATGAPFQTPGDWLVQMLLTYAFPLSLLTFLYRLKNHTLQATLLAGATQFAGVLLYSSRLFTAL